MPLTVLLLKGHIPPPYFSSCALQNNFIPLFLRLGILFMSCGGSFAALEERKHIFPLFKMYFAKQLFLSNCSFLQNIFLYIENGIPPLLDLC